MRNVLLILAMFVSLFACASRRAATPPSTPRPSTTQPSSVPAENLVFRDRTGDVVATAELDLPDKLPPDGQSSRGTWQLRFFKPVFPSSATRNGAYQLQVYEGLVSVNLNPGVMDNNITLGWKAGKEPVEGTWYHSKFTGGEAMGTFTLARPPRDPR